MPVFRQQNCGVHAFAIVCKELGALLSDGYTKVGPQDPVLQTSRPE